MLEIKNVSGSYGKAPIVSCIDFSVHRGEIFGIIGPNGSGKTTLLKMISGTHKLDNGEILLEKKGIHAYSSKQLAQKMAVLPQQSDASFPYTVKEIVALGRYAYQKGFFRFSSAHDEWQIEAAMKQTNVYGFRDQSFLTLSGGERQRVMLARALVQEPDILLLDEPTNHLDISYQMSLLDTLKDWSTTKKLTVITILHDLNMASLYCDRILLLDKGKTVGFGPPAKLMEQSSLESVYQTTLSREHHPNVPRPLILFSPKSGHEAEQGSVVEQFKVSADDERIQVISPVPLKTLSSAVIGAGFGWHRIFVNRHVNNNYNCDDPVREFRAYLIQAGVEAGETVGMMTAAYLKHGSSAIVKKEGVSLRVFVTAGTTNAVDVTNTAVRIGDDVSIGTINIWIFIDGKLTEAAFVQAMMTATEAKAKALQDEEILDLATGTIATGTSTDSIMVAAVQTGNAYEYAGSITSLGRQIGATVYTLIRETIQKNKKGRENR